MRTRRNPLTQADRAEWANYARHIRPLPGHTIPDLPPEPVPPPSPTPTAPPAPTPRPTIRTTPLDVGHHPGGLDNASWNRLRSGKLTPQRTLDLHGRTAQRAFHALQAFLQSAHADRLRCVEIITGRGAGEAGGILRRELPAWLNLPTLRPLILAATHPHPANPGAVRILLRRVK